MLDRPLANADLDRLLGSVEGLDPSTFRAVQVHYTADPVVDVGADDPCAVWGRITLLPGLPVVEVSSLPPAPARAPRQTFAPVAASSYIAPLRGLSFKATRAELYMLACLRAITVAPPGKRHPTIVSVAARLFGLCKSGQLSPAVVAGRIKGAVQRSSFDRSLDEVDSMLVWAWEVSTPWRLS